MPSQKQQIRGNTAASDAFTGAAGVITLDMERFEIRIHDGVTPGGHRVPGLEHMLDTFLPKDSEFGEVSFATDALGMLARIADKTWALRELTGTAPILVTNGNGQSGPPTISLDPNGLQAIHRKYLAGGVTNGDATTGTNTAFVANLPAEWPDTVGSLVILRLHLVPHADGCTLRMRNDLAPLPLKTGTGVTDLSATVSAAEQVLIARGSSSYQIIGTRPASALPIKPIAGFAPTNVQAAIEAIVASIGDESGELGLAGYQSYGALTQIQGPLTAAKLNIADKEARIVVSQRVEVTSPEFNWEYGTQLPTLSAVVQRTEVILFLRNGANYYHGISADFNPVPRIVPNYSAFTKLPAPSPIEYQGGNLYRIPPYLKWMGPNPSYGAKEWNLYISDKRTVL